MAVALIVISFGCLVALHIVSPEFQPSWRVVSEYALGRFGWLLSLMFFAWGASTWTLAAAIWSDVATTRAGRVGRWVLVVAGLGQVMGGLFDVNHMAGHGLAGFLGVLGFPIAALLVSRALDHAAGWTRTDARARRWSAHLTWISVVLLVATLGLMTAQMYRVTGGHLPDHAPTALPPGVIGLDGWADRLIILSAFVWAAVVARQSIRARTVAPLYGG